MKIQFITFDNRKKNNFKNLTYSVYGCPEPLDKYDINIIDLCVKDLYVFYYNGNFEHTPVNENDLISLSKNIKDSTRTKIVFLLPQNFIGSEYDARYPSVTQSNFYLKDKMYLINTVIGYFIEDNFNRNLEYGKNYTLISSEIKLESYFYFSNVHKKYNVFDGEESNDDKNGIEIKAEDTNQITIVEYENHYFTPLLIKNENDLELLLKKIRLIDDTKSYPEWLIALDYFDDELLKKRNLAIKESINKLEKEYNSNVIKLNTNNMYKNIVCLSGQDLVEVVFDILKQILGIDLSNFVDELNEDFLFKLNGITFIGEIKGVTSNIKNANISQLDQHVQNYLDKLEDEGKEENIKGLLIMSHERTKPISDRQPITEKQINIAKRNGSLIIDTIDLLKTYELYCNNKIKREEIIEKIRKEVGLYSL